MRVRMKWLTKKEGERSASVPAINRIGIFDNAEERAYVTQNLQEAFANPSNVITQANGRVLKESLLSDPNGVVKVNSIWEGNKLITVEVFGGGN
jgi:hypothetical protein